MAHVAFDLDRTLGFFEHISPLAFFWSKDFLTNPEQKRINTPLKISRKLEVALTRARETFAKWLLAEPSLLNTILRPDLDELIKPLLKSKKFVTAIIYSNTGIPYSVELAKSLIEAKYKCRGFFALTADNWHPLRTEDHEKKFEEPKKKMVTLQKLFSRATYSQRDVPYKNILFVDDRVPKHDLESCEPKGLVYMNLMPYVPNLSDKQKDNILFLAVAALDKHGLLRSKEYLESGFCNRRIPYDHTKSFPISGFQELLGFVKAHIQGINDTPTRWRLGTSYIKETMADYLENI
jgi:hypothetical protein